MAMEDNMTGNAGWVWVFLIIAIMFGGNGFGFGGANAGAFATMADVNNAINNQSTQQ